MSEVAQIGLGSMGVRMARRQADARHDLTVWNRKPGRADAVVFDLDGTLLDTMISAPTAYAETIRALGGPKVSPADVVAAWHIGPTQVVLEHFLGRPTAAEELECFYRHFDAAVAAVRPFPGVLDMIHAISHAGYRLGIFTSATRRATTLLLAAARLDRFFQSVVCGDEVSRPKPAPEGLRRASENLAVKVADTVYVGDAEVDLQCARAAGAVAIHARWGTATTAAPGFPLTANHPNDVVELLSRKRSKRTAELKVEPPQIL